MPSAGSATPRGKLACLRRGAISATLVIARRKLRGSRLRAPRKIEHLTPLRSVLFVAFCLMTAIQLAQAEEIHVLAAGSLREVISDIGNQYRKATGVEIIAAFGPSGLLRQRIENGEHPDLFASADLGHPLKLAEEGPATRVVMFARNKLCGFAAPPTGLTTANFVDR